MSGSSGRLVGCERRRGGCAAGRFRQWALSPACLTCQLLSAPCRQLLACVRAGCSIQLRPHNRPLPPARSLSSPAADTLRVVHPDLLLMDAHIHRSVLNLQPALQPPPASASHAQRGERVRARQAKVLHMQGRLASATEVQRRWQLDRWLPSARFSTMRIFQQSLESFVHAQAQALGSGAGAGAGSSIPPDTGKQR